MIPNSKDTKHVKEKCGLNCYFQSDTNEKYDQLIENDPKNAGWTPNRQPRSFAPDNKHPKDHEKMQEILVSGWGKVKITMHCMIPASIIL